MVFCTPTYPYNTFTHTHDRVQLTPTGGLHGFGFLKGACGADEKIKTELKRGEDTVLVDTGSDYQDYEHVYCVRGTMEVGLFRVKVRLERMGAYPEL